MPGKGLAALAVLALGASAAPAGTATTSTAALRLAPSIRAQAARPQTVATRWCGTDAVAADRLPEALGGNQIHVVYAFPTGGTDRFASVAGPIATDVEAIETWWQREDPARAPRFDLYAFPSCESRFGQLDLARVQLPGPASAYSSANGGRFSRIVLDLSTVAPSLASSAKKFLVYYDGPADNTHICGESPVLPLSGGLSAASIIYLQACLGTDVGTAGFTAVAATHELIHNLGALVSPGPPHPCPGDPGHPCDSPDDILAPVGHGQPLAATHLDVGRDDYYGHSGSWWDVQDSPWLSHLDVAQVPLAVALTGTGTGAVSSDSAGIRCPAGCSTSYDAGSVVTLSAVPAAGARFAGWSGACTGKGSCTVTLAAAAQVTATFLAQARLTVAVVRTTGGAGTVTSSPAGISCPSTCAASFDRGAVVSLRAKPRTGSRFVGWSGACSGRGRCTVTLAAARSVRATFRR